MSVSKHPHTAADTQPMERAALDVEHVESTAMPKTHTKTAKAIAVDPNVTKLAELKALAEKFRQVADDRPALVKLVNDTRAVQPIDQEVDTLCFRVINAPRGDAVRGIADEIAARKE